MWHQVPWGCGENSIFGSAVGEKVPLMVIWCQFQTSWDIGYPDWKGVTRIIDPAPVPAETPQQSPCAAPAPSFGHSPAPLALFYLVVPRAAPAQGRTISWAWLHHFPPNCCSEHKLFPNLQVHKPQIYFMSASYYSMWTVCLIERRQDCNSLHAEFSIPE